MSKDGLRRLPDHVVAPLLRALMTIPRRPDSRLYLRKVVPPRMHKTAEDYRVVRLVATGGLRREDHVGNIWLDPNPERMEDRIAPWKWSVDTTRGGTDREGWWASGRARTREEAMDAFRNAWDNYQPKKAADPPTR
jgi:hypothetical protein